MPRRNAKPFSQINPDILQTFWEHFVVGAPDACWEWQAFLTQGYAYHRKWLVSRLMFYTKNGFDPGKYMVCHSCDNPKCVNPAHLFLGTLGDNNRDRQAKGRTVLPSVECRPRGESHSATKLTDAQIRDIRRLRTEGYTYARLTEKFGVSGSGVWSIVTRRTWKHVL